jgi:transcriptional regulator with XRE-family HTH domain
MEQTLGKRIVQHRKALGLTQDQLAEKLGVTAQAVSKWENDQSCPDITMLPKLANIFGATTDALLGNEPVHQAEVVQTPKENKKDKHHHFEFNWNLGRNGSLSFALLVLAVGIQMILSKIFAYDISFWNLLWPTALVFFGGAGLFRKFSFVRLGCILFGGYFLLTHWQLLPFTLGGELVFPIILVIFGFSILVDSLKRPKKPHISLTHNGQPTNDFQLDTESFDITASFGEEEKFISIPLLRAGHINTSFGDYTVDLSGVEAVTDPCILEANCSFGELTILVPRKYQVKLDTTTSFGDININGQPDEEPVGTIFIDANASFGEVSIRYI